MEDVASNIFVGNVVSICKYILFCYIYWVIHKYLCTFGRFRNSFQSLCPKRGKIKGKGIQNNMKYMSKMCV